MLPTRLQYVLVTAAVLIASIIQLVRHKPLLIVVIAGLTFLIVGNGTVWLGRREQRKRNRQRKIDYYTHAILFLLLAATAQAQLIPPPAIPDKPASAPKKKQPKEDIEWLWQYGPPPAEGREHELIQDAHFRPMLDRYFTAPQSFWGPEKPRKSLPDTIEDFLAIPNKVVADEQRYLTVTGCVFHFCPSRGLLFADLNSPHPLVVFAAIDWIRDSRPTTDPTAEYTLWIFPNHAPGPPEDPTRLPLPLVRSLTRWMPEPVARTGIVQRITNAILVDPDGTPHQIPVPAAAEQNDAAPIRKRGQP